MEMLKEVFRLTSSIGDAVRWRAMAIFFLARAADAEWEALESSWLQRAMAEAAVIPTHSP